MTARFTCGHCGTAMDPDAPGAACATCHAEAGALREPDATSRRDTGAASGSRRASSISSIARVYAIACALAGDDRPVTDADMALASAIHRSPVEA